MLVVQGLLTQSGDDGHHTFHRQMEVCTHLKWCYFYFSTCLVEHSDHIWTDLDLVPKTCIMLKDKKCLFLCCNKFLGNVTYPEELDIWMKAKDTIQRLQHPTDLMELKYLPELSKASWIFSHTFVCPVSRNSPKSWMNERFCSAQLSNADIYALEELMQHILDQITVLYTQGACLRLEPCPDSSKQFEASQFERSPRK